MFQLICIDSAYFYVLLKFIHEKSIILENLLY